MFKNHKLLVLLIFSCLFTLTSIAQIDSSTNTGTEIPASKSEEAKEKANLLESKPIENHGMTNLDKDKVNGMSVPKQGKMTTPKKEFSMFGEKFGNPGELYESRIEKHARSFEHTPEDRDNGSTTNQYLGDFKTKVSRVNIIYRDHQYPDGDRVRVFVNDDVVQADVLLFTSFKGFKLELVPGFNKIDFQALNQGESGPNTAELQVLDDKGNVIASSQWNLATGVKATLIVIKE